MCDAVRELGRACRRAERGRACWRRRRQHASSLADAPREEADGRNPCLLAGSQVRWATRATALLTPTRLRSCTSRVKSAHGCSIGTARSAQRPKRPTACFNFLAARGIAGPKCDTAKKLVCACARAFCSLEGAMCCKVFSLRDKATTATWLAVGLAIITERRDAIAYLLTACCIAWSILDAQREFNLTCIGTRSCRVA